MNLKKPKFWDYKKPNIYSYILWPISILVQIANHFRIKSSKKNYKIKKICLGNFYVGGTGKTSLSIKIKQILTKKKIKSCFIKKYYPDQIDEQRLLKNKGKLFSEKKRTDSLNKALRQNYKVAIFDDGLQDKSINYDISIVCFNDLNWVGNGMTIPSGPLRQKLSTLTKYNYVFLNGNSKNINSIKKRIFQINPKINIYTGQYIPLNLKDFNLKNKFLVFSGIGNHKTFINMLKKSRINVVKDIEFPDHYSFKKIDINKILVLSKKLNCKIITTEKDYLRLKTSNIDQIKYIKSELHIPDEDRLINDILK